MVGYILKDSPQPQLDLLLGFVIVNSDLNAPFSQSKVVPIKYNSKSLLTTNTSFKTISPRSSSLQVVHSYSKPAHPPPLTLKRQYRLP